MVDVRVLYVAQLSEGVGTGRLSRWVMMLSFFFRNLTVRIITYLQTEGGQSVCSH